jgi:hypothetical protein
MRSMLRMFVLAAVATSATAAFAFDKVTVNVPFQFEARGQIFPAGAYEVGRIPTQDTLTLYSKTNTKVSFMWVAFPAEFGPKMSILSLKFEDEGDGTRALRSIRLAGWTTPVLDVRERHAAQRNVSITGGR